MRSFQTILRLGMILDGFPIAEAHQTWQHPLVKGVTKCSLIAQEGCISLTMRLLIEWPIMLVKEPRGPRLYFVVANSPVYLKDWKLPRLWHCLQDRGGLETVELLVEFSQGVSISQGGWVAPIHPPK